MRLLWFTNIVPAAVNDPAKTVGGSWVEALERQIGKYAKVELGIVFTELAKEPRTIKNENTGTTYFSIPRYPYDKSLRWLHRLTAPRYSDRNLKRYLKAVKDFQPDAVLFFGTENEYPLIIPQLQIPSIIWFQGNRTIYNRMYQSGISLRSTLRHERLKDIVMGNAMFQKYRHFKRAVEREKQIFSNAKNFIGRTNWDGRVVNTMAPQAKYFHCDEPMRQAFIDNQWVPKPSRDKFVIVTTIRGNLYKGLETIYEACELLKGRIKENFQWRVVGIVEGSVYVKTIRKNVKASVSDSMVNLLGSRSGSEIVSELLDANIYVHPSHIENSPNAVQEAMLLGMPVIATNVGGTPSMLKDNEEGLLVQNKDPYALAGAVLELYESPLLAKKLGENARKLGLLRNNSQKICTDLVGIFQQLINERQTQKTDNGL